MKELKYTFWISVNPLETRDFDEKIPYRYLFMNQLTLLTRNMFTRFFKIFRSEHLRISILNKYILGTVCIVIYLACPNLKQHNSVLPVAKRINQINNYVLIAQNNMITLQRLDDKFQSFDPHTSILDEETFLQDFRIILKNSLQNYWKIKKMFPQYYIDDNVFNGIQIVGVLPAAIG